MAAWGFDTALNEITLVFFTTLAPSGVLALCIMGGVLIGARLTPDMRQRINRFLCIPLIISMVGLVASATHLGNPANALYVFLGVGRSPLSTEVFCAVIFLMLAGVYWLYSFSRNPRVGLQKVWVACASLAGLAFVAAIAFAYDAQTIVSWNTPFVPANIVLGALLGGPLVAFLSLRVARFEPLAGRFGWLLCATSAAALLVGTLVLALQSAQMPLLGNSFGTVADLVPGYPAVIVAYFVCAGAAILLYAVPLKAGRMPKVATGIASSALVFVGIFLTRFAFYMMHMTVGLSM